MRSITVNRIILPVLWVLVLLPGVSNGDDIVTPDKVPSVSAIKRMPFLLDVAKQVAVQNELGLANQTKINRLLSQRTKAIDQALAKAGVHPSAIRRMSSEDKVSKSHEIFAKISIATRSASAPFDEKLKDILSADQYGRIVEIYAQWGGIDALAHPVIAEALGLSKEQLLALDSICAECDLALQTTSSPNRERIAEEMFVKANKVLDGAQTPKLSALRGKPFDFLRFFKEDPATKEFYQDRANK